MRNGGLETMAAIGAWKVDLQSGEVAWSDQVRRIHEVAEDSVITLDFGFNFYAAHDRDMVRSVVGGAIERGEPFHFDADFVTATGHLRRVRVAGVRTVGEGVPMPVPHALAVATPGPIGR